MAAQNGLYGSAKVAVWQLETGCAVYGPGAHAAFPPAGDGSRLAPPPVHIMFMATSKPRPLKATATPLSFSSLPPTK